MSPVFEFYLMAIYYASHSKRGIGKIKDIIYDPKFTSERVIRELKNGTDPNEIEIPRFYEQVFKELDYMSDNFNNLDYICSSDDIKEPIECGNFVYYAGILTIGIAVLYMKSTHPWALPSRAVIYGDEFQIEFCNTVVPISFFPVNERIRDKIMTENHRDRKYYVKEYLMNTDRPLINK